MYAWGNSELFFANCLIGSISTFSRMKSKFAIPLAAESQLAGTPSEHALYASTSTSALASACKVEVEAKLTCTLGGNSELFLANCLIGSIGTFSRMKSKFAIPLAAESQLAGAPERTRRVCLDLGLSLSLSLQGQG